MNTSHIDIISQGAYARKQLFCKDWIVLWSHTSRFQLARTLVQPFAGHKLLDYGCGDGTFLALVYDLFPEAVGVDIDPKQMADCTKRFAKSPGLEFHLAHEINTTSHEHQFDIVTCMEVLEHCVDKQLPDVISRLRHLVSNNGTVVISVPIEIGFSLFGKLTRL